MSATEVLKGVRFVVDAEGRPIAALLDMALWNYVVGLLEDAEDIDLAREALARLEAAGGSPEKAGWLDFEAVSVELNGEV